MRRGEPAEASAGHEAGQGVQTEHPQAEEEGDEGAARARCHGVSDYTVYCVYYSSLSGAKTGSEHLLHL